MSICPVCIRCEQEMLPLKNGICVVTYTQSGPTPDDKDPDMRYYGDAYQCPACGVKIVAGFGLGKDVSFKTRDEAWNMADVPVTRS